MTMNTPKAKKRPTAMERRRIARKETITEILDIAAELMREEGVAALNVSEVARRMGMRPQSLAEYFPSKSAMYDALFVKGVRLMHEGDDRAFSEHGPDWARVQAWFENRLTFAEEHPELYHLVLEMPVPGFEPSDESRQAVRDLLETVRSGLMAVMEAGAMVPGMPPERAIDILLTARRGVVAEQIGKKRLLSERSNRFRGLIPDIIAIYRAAWRPEHGEPPADQRGRETPSDQGDAAPMM